MSSSLHPHWQADDGEEAPAVAVHANRPASKSAPVHGSRTVSRKPAAIMGIAAVSILLLTFFGGTEMLRGQLSESTLQITITAESISPPDAEVQPGMRVAWLNEDSIPHILASDTLCRAPGDCLYSSPIFPGESWEWTAWEDSPRGTFDYGSVTNTDLKGTLTFGAASSSSVASQASSSAAPIASSSQRSAAALPHTSSQASSFSVMTVSSASSEAQFVEQFPSADDAPTDFPEASPFEEEIESPLSGLPYNPYTVGSRETGPSKEPQTSRSPLRDQLHAGAGPYKQPQTGMGTWIVIGIAGIALWNVWRMAKAAFIG